MNMGMNIQKCRAFVQTVESGSFTQAAQALSYSQSGISRMIADLENEWGVDLLQRSRGGVSLTSEGTRLLPFVRSLCAEYDALQAEVDSIKGLERGLIRVGTFSSVATHVLPALIRRFQEEYPGIEYELALGDYREIEQWVLEGRVDCGFTKLPPAPGLDARLFEEDELLAVLPEGHPLAERENVPLAALCDDPFMMLGRDRNTEVADVFAEVGLHPRVKFTTWDDYSIMAMVERGMGVALLHSLILQRAAYRVVTKHLDHPVYRRIGIVTRAGKTPSRATKAFLSSVRFD